MLARVVLVAFCHNKLPYIFLFHQKHSLNPRTRGLKKRPAHYKTKKIKHPDSLNEVFHALITMQKPQLSEKFFFEKIKKNRQNDIFFKNAMVGGFS